MLIPMYLLIAVWGGPQRDYASIKFFIYTLFGSVFLLVAIIALYLTNGTFSIPEAMFKSYNFTFQVWVFLAFAIAFAIKVPMFPFHTWLPAAHTEAPTAGSVFLASILLKMGAYGFMRFSLPITPEASFFFAPYMVALSLVGIIYGGFVCLSQTDMKKLIAYSSVAHMGFVTLGIFTFTKIGFEGALLQMLNHGITTGALFLSVGIIYERTHSREIYANAGLGKIAPVYVGFFGLFAISSFGFPGTNNFVGELYVLVSTFVWNRISGRCRRSPGGRLHAQAVEADRLGTGRQKEHQGHEHPGSDIPSTAGCLCDLGRPLSPSVYPGHGIHTRPFTCTTAGSCPLRMDEV
jgi:NADH-quinone oxidoreductase subunit M